MRRHLLALLVVLAYPAAVAAQDFGTDWVDRVTHERMQDRGPLQPRAVSTTGVVGADVYNDNNIFLDPKTTNHRTSNVVVPFLGGRLDYSEQQFEGQIDALGDWKYYNGYPHESSFEEFLFGHARFVGSKLTVAADELLTHQSDAVDGVFFNKAKHMVSDSVATGTYDVSKVFAVEAKIDYQVVRFEQAPLTYQENNENYRFDGSVVYRMSNGYDWFARVGYLDIYYDHVQQAGAPPDTKGYYANGGFRGDLMQRLAVELYAGWASVRSERFVNTQIRDKLTTGEFGLHARYEATDKLVFYGDISRTIGWAGGPDPFDVVTRGVIIGEYEPVEHLKLRVRFQIDHVGLPESGTRDYRSAGASAGYDFSEHINAEVGATYRTGDFHAATGTETYKDSIVHLGLVITF